RGIVAQNQLLLFPIADQRQARLILHDLLHVELHWLEIARRARRLQTGAFQFSRHISRGFQVLWASGVTPLHVVVRERLDMGPAAVALSVEIGRRMKREA